MRKFTTAHRTPLPTELCMRRTGHTGLNFFTKRKKIGSLFVQQAEAADGLFCTVALLHGGLPAGPQHPS